LHRTKSRQRLKHRMLRQQKHTGGDGDAVAAKPLTRRLSEFDLRTAKHRLGGARCCRMNDTPVTKLPVTMELVCSGNKDMHKTEMENPDVYKTEMGRHEFSEACHILADRWTECCDVEEYVKFLQSLIHTISYEPESEMGRCPAQRRRVLLGVEMVHELSSVGLMEIRAPQVDQVPNRQTKTNAAAGGKDDKARTVCEQTMDAASTSKNQNQNNDRSKASSEYHAKSRGRSITHKMKKIPATAQSQRSSHTACPRRCSKTVAEVEERLVVLQQLQLKTIDEATSQIEVLKHLQSKYPGKDVRSSAKVPAQLPTIMPKEAQSQQTPNQAQAAALEYVPASSPMPASQKERERVLKMLAAAEERRQVMYLMLIAETPSATVKSTHCTERKLHKQAQTNQTPSGNMRASRHLSPDANRLRQSNSTGQALAPIRSPGMGTMISNVKRRKMPPALSVSSSSTQTFAYQKGASSTFSSAQNSKQPIATSWSIIAQPISGPAVPWEGSAMTLSPVTSASMHYHNLPAIQNKLLRKGP